MTDTKILYAVETLHLDFIKEPTERKAHHIGEFIERSIDDLTPDAMLSLTRYCDAMNAAVCFNFQSLARVKSAAKETFKEIAA